MGQPRYQTPHWAPEPSPLCKGDSGPHHTQGQGNSQKRTTFNKTKRERTSVIYVLMTYRALYAKCFTDISDVIFPRTPGSSLPQGHGRRSRDLV